MSKVELTAGRGATGGGFGALRAVAAAVAVVMAAATAVAQPLNSEIRGIIEKAKLGGAKVGVSVIDAETGSVLAQVRVNAPAGAGGFSPASNMKLLTSGAALLVLGPEFEFRTRVYRAGTRLVIEGSGDPALADPKLLETMHQGVGEFVDRLVKSVVDASGDKGAFTEVVVDDRVFDREYVRESWPVDQRLEAYSAEVSGLNFHTNILRLLATPAEQDGLAPKLRWEPVAPGLDIHNNVRTVRKATDNIIGKQREGDTNTITVRGSLRSALSSPEAITLHETGLVLARMVAERLAAAGLGASGAAPACRLVGLDEQLGPAEREYVVVRTPMATILERCNQDSHNLYAECLLKRMGNAVTGQPGSWTNGAAVVRMQVRERIGPEAATALLIVDGSGLSRGNAVTPELLTGWLSVMARDPKAGEAFVGSLAVAGVDGTMTKRFKDKKLGNEVRGKSGLIDGVRCLSGYVTSKPSGRRLAYSILVNDMPASVPGTKVKEFHEEVVAAVDKWLSAHSRAEAEAVGG